MIIDGVVVLYNPTDDIYDNIVTYVPFLHRLFVLDNSDTRNEGLLSKLSNFKNAAYISLCGNKGIAKALKEGMELSLSDHADFTLTMDQDSSFPTEKIEEVTKYLVKYQNEYAIIGLNVNKEEQEEKLVDVHELLTSGNFINNKFYREIDGFNEDLFIDYVDFDLCEQFSRIGKKIGYINNVSIKHTIGNPIEFKFFGKTYHALNHNPIRYYYRYRNALYLYKRNKKFYRKKYKHDLYIDKLKIVLFEKNKKLKLKLIRRGRKDARKGILGPYKED